MWAENIQAATVNIVDESDAEWETSQLATCPSAWRFATSELLGIEDTNLLNKLCDDPAYFSHLQRTIAEALYQRRVGVPSQDTRVLKIQTENETYQNMGNCLIRTKEVSEGGLDIMFTMN